MVCDTCKTILTRMDDGFWTCKNCGLCNDEIVKELSWCNVPYNEPSRRKSERGKPRYTKTKSQIETMRTSREYSRVRVSKKARQMITKFCEENKLTQVHYISSLIRRVLMENEKEERDYSEVYKKLKGEKWKGIHIWEELHAKLKKFCKKRNFFMSAFTTLIILEELKDIRKDKKFLIKDLKDREYIAEQLKLEYSKIKKNSIKKWYSREDYDYELYYNLT